MRHRDSRLVFAMLVVWFVVGASAGAQDDGGVAQRSPADLRAMSEESHARLRTVFAEPTAMPPCPPVAARGELETTADYDARVAQRKAGCDRVQSAWRDWTASQEQRRHAAAARAFTLPIQHVLSKYDSGAEAFLFKLTRPDGALTLVDGSETRVARLSVEPDGTWTCRVPVSTSEAKTFRDGLQLFVRFTLAEGQSASDVWRLGDVELLGGRAAGPDHVPVVMSARLDTCVTNTTFSPDEGVEVAAGLESGGSGQPRDRITLPRILREVKPAYTKDAERAKVQGTVILQCVVQPDGSVGNIQVVRSLDTVFGLDEEAIKAARQWRFVPGMRMGQPVRVQITLELTFTLRP